MQATQSITMTTQKAAEFLNISHRTLEGWRCERRGPAYLKLGRRVVYRLEDLIKFQEQSLIRVDS